jgi:hypothetical protein
METEQSPQVATSRAGSGIWAGALPLLLALVVFFLAEGITIVARIALLSAGFLFWRGITDGTIAVGLVVAAIVYVVFAVRALRQATAWQRGGAPQQAAATYWTLLIAALVLLIPVIVALALPQHPAV